MQFFVSNDDYNKLATGFKIEKIERNREDRSGQFCLRQARSPRNRAASSAKPRQASAASQERSPTPALRATPPKRGVRHITELRSGQFHYRASLGAQYGLRPCQYPSGASTITERSCPYALWAWKNFNTCQLRLLRARSLSRLGLTSSGQFLEQLFPVPGSRRITKHGTDTFF